MTPDSGHDEEDLKTQMSQQRPTCLGAMIPPDGLSLPASLVDALLALERIEELRQLREEAAYEDRQRQVVWPACSDIR